MSVLERNQVIVLMCLYEFSRTQSIALDAQGLGHKTGLSATEINQAVEELKKAGLVWVFDGEVTPPYSFYTIKITAQGKYEYSNQKIHRKQEEKMNLVISSLSAIKLVDKAETTVNELVSGIKQKDLGEIKTQIEILSHLIDSLKDLLPSDFYNKTMSDFLRHLKFVRRYYGESNFEWMGSNADDLKERDIPFIREEIMSFMKTSDSEKKAYCFKMGALCSKQITVNPRQVFIGMPFRPKFIDSYKHGILPVLEKYDLKCWKADEDFDNIDILCKICEHLQESKYAIMNITDWNANVLFELGLAYGLGKTVIIIKDKDSTVPVDLSGIEYRSYQSSEDLEKSLDSFFSNLNR